MIRTKVPKPKYIAEGFHDDAGDLINEFTEKSTTEFSKFTEIWKRRHFSLVFMGRPDQVENTEFTNEAFKISTQFLSSPSFYEKVGAVYLLYALFRNQISVPSIKIRLEINQWRVIQTLHIEAKLKKHNTLHYVIDYLVKNAFIYTARQMLRGPITGMQNLSKNYDVVSNLKTNYKSDITEYSVSNNLLSLRDLHKQYLEEKKTFCDEVKININAASDSYDFFIHDLKSIVDPAVTKSKKETLGSRRAKLKAQSFIRKTQDRFGNDVDDKDESDPDTELCKKESPKKRIKTRRLPQHERRVGRPSKKPKPKVEPEEKSDDDDVDFSHLLSQQKELYLPQLEEVENKKKSKSRREHYYKVSPKREEDSSDPDEATVHS